MGWVGRSCRCCHLWQAHRESLRKSQSSKPAAVRTRSGPSVGRLRCTTCGACQAVRLPALPPRGFGARPRSGCQQCLRADRLMNPATYGCRKDEGEYAAERLLNGVRVGEENLLEPLRLA